MYRIARPEENELGLRNIAFEVDDLQAMVDRWLRTATGWSAASANTRALAHGLRARAGGNHRVPVRVPQLSASLIGRAPGQDKPTIVPSSSRSIREAAGVAGSPGIVITSPHTRTTKPAPAESRTSRTCRS